MHAHQIPLLPSPDPYLKFVVHLHQATSLHYDLRLELGKTLFCLVLPKGPSLDPTVNRLAIPTHDHSKSCLTLEGRISPGRYGAGPILMWDRGLYAPRCLAGVSHEEAIQRGLHRGKLLLVFHGSKLQGGWTLRRFRDNWLFTKTEDNFISECDIRLRDHSVLSGKQISQL